MNVEIGTEAVQFSENEYINGIFLAVQEDGEVTSSLDNDQKISGASSSATAVDGFNYRTRWAEAATGAAIVVAVAVASSAVTAVAVKAWMEAAAAAEAAAREAAAAAAREAAANAVQLVMAFVGAFGWVLRVAW
jgi:hypothetical protein